MESLSCGFLHMGLPVVPCTKVTEINMASDFP